ncbi:MAG: GNAT family N-acetyltransferase [Gammaproteobacteria bacterium]|nr:MAG: GNAT family N-acetyltransferase [Gammaproteobacteria bacterium]
MSTTACNELGQPIGQAMPDWQGCRPPPRSAMEGRHVRVVPLARAQVDSLFDAYSDDTEGRVWTYLPVGPFFHRDAFEQWFDWALASNDPMFHAIVDKASGRALGVASYLRIEPSIGVIEVGYIAMAPALQKTIQATEAMFLMMRRAFGELGYRRYEWKCDDLNAASKSAALRLGFSHDGRFPQAQVYKGRNRDTAWFSVLDKDWPRLERAFECWLDDDNFDAAGCQMQSLRDLTQASRRA